MVGGSILVGWGIEQLTLAQGDRLSALGAVLLVIGLAKHWRV